MSQSRRPWKIEGKSVGMIRGGVYYVSRMLLGRRAKFSTGCVTETAAVAEYHRFEAAPAAYVSLLGRRPFAGVCTKGRRQRPEAAEDARRRRLNLKYRLTPEGYAQLFQKQAGCCAICGRRAEDSTAKTLAVDHDHATGVVRGLLCSHCNRGLGHFGDSAAHLRAAATYLDAFSTDNPRTMLPLTGTGGPE